MGAGVHSSSLSSFLVSTKKDLDDLHLSHLFFDRVEDTIFNTACLNGGEKRKERETEIEHIIQEGRA